MGILRPEDQQAMRRLSLLAKVPEPDYYERQSCCYVMGQGEVCLGAKGLCRALLDTPMVSLNYDWTVRAARIAQGNGKQGLGT